MLTSENKAIRIWLALIEQFPLNTVNILKSIRDGKAYLPTPSSQPTMNRLTEADVFNEIYLVDFLENHKNPGLGQLSLSSSDNPTRYTVSALAVKLEKLLSAHCDKGEACRLYSVLVRGEAPKKWVETNLVLTELRAEHIWRALIKLLPHRAAGILENIHNGLAYINVSAPATIPFTAADIYDAPKLEQFLTHLPDPVDVEEITRRASPGHQGEFRETFLDFLQHNWPPKQADALEEMFFKPVQRSESKAAREEPETKEKKERLTDVYEIFIEKGKQLGIPMVHLSAILPEDTRQQLLIELLETLQTK